MVKGIIEIEHKILINKTVKLYSMAHCGMLLKFQVSCLVVLFGND